MDETQRSFHQAAHTRGYGRVARFAAGASGLRRPRGIRSKRTDSGHQLCGHPFAQHQRRLRLQGGEGRWRVKYDEQSVHKVILKLTAPKPRASGKTFGLTIDQCQCCPGRPSRPPEERPPMPGDAAWLNKGSSMASLSASGSPSRTRTLLAQ